MNALNSKITDPRDQIYTNTLIQRPTLGHLKTTKGIDCRFDFTHHTRDQNAGSGQQLVTLQNAHKFTHGAVDGPPVIKQLLCGTPPLCNKAFKSPDKTQIDR